MGSADEEERGENGRRVRSIRPCVRIRPGCWIYLQLQLQLQLQYVYLLSPPSEVRPAISGQALPGRRVDGERSQVNLSITTSHTAPECPDCTDSRLQTGRVEQCLKPSHPHTLPPLTLQTIKRTTDPTKIPNPAHYSMIGVAW